MRIEDVIKRAVVIDNIVDEGKGVVKALDQADVPTDFIHVKSDGSEDVVTSYAHPRELIIADLLLNEKQDEVKTNISRLIGIINKLQPDNAKFYGIVVWTKHINLTDDFLERISKAVKLGMEYGEKNEAQEEKDEEELATVVYLRNPPLFILQLDKMRYNKEGEWNFSNLLNDINVELEKSKTAYFSLRWKQKVNEAIDNVTNQIFQLATDYKKYEDELPFLLKELSKNETGEKEDESLTVGAYKAFDNLLHSELTSIIEAESFPDLSGIIGNPYGDDIKKMQIMSAKINASLFIDSHIINTKEILPGNIYRVLDTNSPLNVLEEDSVEIPLKGDQEKFNLSKKYSKVNIAIELTPPCDFSNKKIYSRYVGGYIFDIPLGHFKLGKKNNIIFESPREDKRYALSPVFVPNEEHVKCIVFDFRYLWTLKENEINDELKYKLWFKAKPGLFADILQKFSSHASRLGINDIHLEKTL